MIEPPCSIIALTSPRIFVRVACSAFGSSISIRSYVGAGATIRLATIAGGEAFGPVAKGVMARRRIPPRLRTPLQLAAVAALIALIFGLPRLRGQPPQIPDPAPRPLVEAAATTAAPVAAAAPLRRQRDRRPTRPRRRGNRARPKRRSQAKRKPAPKPPARPSRPSLPKPAPASPPSAAAAPAREFGWP